MPDSATGVPPVIAEASEALLAASAAQHAAGERLRRARDAAQTAVRDDANAAAEAIARGDDPPPSTVASTRAEEQAARQAWIASTSVAERAALALERRYREAGESWLPTVRADAEAAQTAALNALDELAELVDRLIEPVSIVHELQRENARRVDRCRQFKSRPIAANELVALREAIVAVVPPLDTAAIRAECEAERLAHRRREVEMAQAAIGVYVGEQRG